jgi:hypothetical protein
VEVTGGNFPHYTNQPQKVKTDRVLTRFVIPWGCKRLYSFPLPKVITGP